MTMTSSTGAQAASAAEREEFGLALREFLAKTSTEETVRTLMETESGFDAATWAQLATQLGAAGLLIPETHGGLGLSMTEAVVALQETGRALYGGPLLGSSVLATAALLAAGDDPAVADLLATMSAGSMVCCIGLDDGDTVVRAVRSDSSWRLSGVKRHVVDAVGADTVLVTAVADGGVGLFVLPAASPGVNVESTACLDLTRRIADVQLSDVPAQRIGDDFALAADTVRDIGAVACAAEQAGIAARCLQLGVEYAGTREQFGRPIGSFQAIKHLLAEHYARVEQMVAGVTAAAATLAQPGQPAAEIVSVVKIFCGEQGTRVTEGLIDILGGIGFTWEHAAHLYLRRMKTLEYLFGSPDQHRQRLSAELGLKPSQHRSGDAHDDVC